MNEETRDEAQGLGASDQADGGGESEGETNGEATETAEAPKPEETSTEGD